MTPEPLPPVLDWARRLQAMAQTGLTFARDPYDLERYRAIHQMAAEMVAHAAGAAEVAPILDLLATETGYATPKVDVRGVVFDDRGSLLLVKERSDGKWTLPGGWADVNQSPAENVVREVREEAGYEARATKLLAVFDKNKHAHRPVVRHVYKMFIRCEITGGAAAHGGTNETDGVAFYPADGLPELSTDRNTAGQLARMFEHFRRPDLPADFD